MRTAIPIELLEVIGYADSLAQGMLPSVVPPVFRFREQPDRVIVPPFSLSAGFVCGATEINGAKAQELIEAEEIVLLVKPFQALIHFELWIDGLGEARYENRIVARASLERAAQEAIESATVAFHNGQLAEAERYCTVAISASDKRVEALAIKAAIRRREGDAEGEQLMGTLAAPYLNQAKFTALVDDYVSPGIQAAQVVAGASRRPPMQGVAAIREAIAA